MPSSRQFLDADKPESKKHLSPKEVGCAFCPLNKVPGIHKVKGEVHGREIFIWGIAPGPQENEKLTEFIGKSGELLWQELERVGILRSKCDVQNIVRCFPADQVENSRHPLKKRNPSKEEIHCCSVYTKDAIRLSRAKMHLIFGKVTAKNVLGTEFKKGKKAFRSERLNAHVFCFWHPTYLVMHGCSAGSTQEPNAIFKQWRKDLEMARHC